MPSAPYLIRTVEAEDVQSIGQVIRHAFAADAKSLSEVLEAPLVEQLRTEGDLLLEQVLVDDAGLIQGHVAVSKVRIQGSPVLIGGQLAPVSVHPRSQGLGYGRQLVYAAIDASRSLGIDVLFVLGDPAYYGALGFEACEIKSAYGPSIYYRACFLRGLPLDLSRARVTLAAAFAALD